MSPWSKYLIIKKPADLWIILQTRCWECKKVDKEIPGFPLLLILFPIQSADQGLKQEVDLLKKELTKRDIVITKLENACVSYAFINHSGLPEDSMTVVNLGEINWGK